MFSFNFELQTDNDPPDALVRMKQQSVVKISLIKIDCLKSSAFSGAVFLSFVSESTMTTERFLFGGKHWWDNDIMLLRLLSEWLLRELQQLWKTPNSRGPSSHLMSPLTMNQIYLKQIRPSCLVWFETVNSWLLSIEHLTCTVQDSLGVHVISSPTSTSPLGCHTRVSVVIWKCWAEVIHQQRAFMRSHRRWCFNLWGLIWKRAFVGFPRFLPVWSEEHLAILRLQPPHPHVQNMYSTHTIYIPYFKKRSVSRINGVRCVI